MSLTIFLCRTNTNLNISSDEVVQSRTRAGFYTSQLRLSESLSRIPERLLHAIFGTRSELHEVTCRGSNSPASSLA